jgi:hypothetical protein
MITCWIKVAETVGRRRTEAIVRRGADPVVVPSLALPLAFPFAALPLLVAPFPTPLVPMLDMVLDLDKAIEGKAEVPRLATAPMPPNPPLFLLSFPFLLSVGDDLPPPGGGVSGRGKNCAKHEAGPVNWRWKGILSPKAYICAEGRRT